MATSLIDNRTSLIVEPRMGRMPPLTPEAQARAAKRREHGLAHPADSWLDRSIGDRCIASGNLQLVERFSRISEDTLRQEITFHDPTTWTQPWTLVLHLKKTDEALFEYACHEGNHSMEGILAGQRAQDRGATNDH